MTQDPEHPRYNQSALDARHGQAGAGQFSRVPTDLPKGERLDRRRVIVVLIAILVVLLGTGVTVWALNRGAPDSVSEVADAAVDAAKDLDVDAGVDLLCEPPSSAERARLDELIASGKKRAGTDDPDVHSEVANITGKKSGSFQMTIWSDDGDLDKSYLVAQLKVEQDGERSCVADVDVEDKPGPLPFLR